MHYSFEILLDQILGILFRIKKKNLCTKVGLDYNFLSFCYPICLGYSVVLAR